MTASNPNFKHTKAIPMPRTRKKPDAIDLLNSRTIAASSHFSRSWKNYMNRKNKKSFRSWQPSENAASNKLPLHDKLETQRYFYPAVHQQTKEMIKEELLDEAEDRTYNRTRPHPEITDMGPGAGRGTAGFTVIIEVDSKHRVKERRRKCSKMGSWTIDLKNWPTTDVGAQSRAHARGRHGTPTKNQSKKRETTHRLTETTTTDER